MSIEGLMRLIELFSNMGCGVCSVSGPFQVFVAKERVRLCKVIDFLLLF